MVLVDQVTLDGSAVVEVPIFPADAAPIVPVGVDEEPILAYPITPVLIGKPADDVSWIVVICRAMGCHFLSDGQAVADIRDVPIQVGFVLGVFLDVLNDPGLIEPLPAHLAFERVVLFRVVTHTVRKPPALPKLFVRIGVGVPRPGGRIAPAGRRRCI